MAMDCPNVSLWEGSHLLRFQHDWIAVPSNMILPHLIPLQLTYYLLPCYGAMWYEGECCR